MGKIIFFLIFWWFILKKRLDRFQWNFQGLLTSLNPRRVQNFMTNRAHLHVEINTWKSRFSQITIFLYSGRWQTYFSKLEEWFRCNFQHSVLVLIPCKIHFGCRRLDWPGFSLFLRIILESFLYIRMVVNSNQKNFFAKILKLRVSPSRFHDNASRGPLKIEKLRYLRACCT